MSKHREVTDFYIFKIPGVTVTAMLHSDGRNWNHFDGPVCFLSSLMLRECHTHTHTHFQSFIKKVQQKKKNGTKKCGIRNDFKHLSL